MTHAQPPEQKSHSTSLPTSPDRPLGVGGRRYASRNWSDNDIRPPRTRFLYASPRGSVGSSADILLTPIRGSTALSDEDFVFLPNRDEIIQTQNELAETPGSPVQNVLNAPNSEMRPHPVLLEPIVIEPTYTSQPELIPLEFKPLPAPPRLEPLSHPAPEPEPGPEPEDPSTPVARSFISETQTITNAVVEVNPKVHRESLVVLLAPGSKGSTRELPGDRGIEPTSPITPQTPLQQSAPISVPTKSPSPPTKLLTVVTEIPSQQNIIPFPSNLESARTPTRDQRPYSIAITEAASTEPHHGAGVTWVISAYQTACGIMLLAIDCYRWLVRKGFRDDFQAIIRDPRFRDYLAILKGARNGFVYGVKIRFPHALLMAILFGRGDWSQRAKTIFKATKQHATNLAKFVTIYKTLLLIQRRANGGKEKSADSFFAGLIGGYLVFGDRTAINEQIVLYVCSRVVASFIPRAFPSPPHNPNGDVLIPARSVPPDSRIFSVFAAVSWGAVMWLFKYRPETLQPGMANSMQYLYRDSEAWNNLKTLLWHNK
ncbi:Peroxisomal membrane protein 4 AltName: Full=24 kDa peroxisomal intrinsic membrane protein [Rhizoctonia solani AG-1 IB]|uniref:Rhizoctonia solani AG1-IB WGS project CAOJ00000000 data, isolate 7/3/14, contig 03511 n=1 Tax=Thanatephorus cucumeris (strain AG1-IB / isolate 7/3/14) TaxID=1108050 RepID=M5BLR8_THACB|nr:Peroxisomal membrane protein 4 AltName: Full=24 kDa peroxisomal intrinsic membrane protein [Rhizoctonia solani AG-1 IB]